MRGQVGRVGQAGRGGKEGREGRTAQQPQPAAAKQNRSAAPDQKKVHEEKKRADAEARKKTRAEQALRTQIDELETRIADRERQMRELEQTMATPGFYDDRTTAQPTLDRHQALMWELGDLMHQWEELQSRQSVTNP